MVAYLKQIDIPLFASLLALTVTLGLSAENARAESGNPCSGKMVNPCAAQNPCAAKNLGAARDKIDPKLITRPPGTKLLTGNRSKLVKEGKQLWNDKNLSTNGLSCETCHQGGAAFLPTFAQPYPHYVAMAKEKAGVKEVHLDEMIQACMVIPMAAEPLPWDSKQLAALTAYVTEVQKTFKPKAGAANPCAAKNPCAMKNPCAGK